MKAQKFFLVKLNEDCFFETINQVGHGAHVGMVSLSKVKHMGDDMGYQQIRVFRIAGQDVQGVYAEDIEK